MKRNLLKRYFLILDFFCILISFMLSAWVRYGGITSKWFEINVYGVAFIIILTLYMVIYFLFDNNNDPLKRGFLEEMLAVIKINGCLAVTLTAFIFIFKEGTAYSRIFFICFIFLNICVTYLFRQYFKIILLAVYKKSSSCRRIMLITTKDQVKEVLEKILQENEWEYRITYITVVDQRMVGQKINGIEVKADYSDMYTVAKKEALDGVFIHIPNDNLPNINLDEIVQEFQNMGMMVDLSINTFGLKVHEKVVRQLSGYHVLTFSSRLYNESQLFLKRIVDILGGFVGCFLTICLSIFIAPAILIESRGPVFFSQVRIGRNGRRFRIYKFRSMYTDAEARLSELMKHNEMSGCMFKMKNDPRITRVGKFLRKTSLDEFPQFFNILKGDMSLVGTRPPTEKEFLQYEGRHKRRLTLKSGLTGLWQVSGRSDITNFEEVVKLDLEYIDNWSFLLDLKILIKTVFVVLFRKGSS